MKNANAKYVILAGSPEGQEVVGIVWESNERETIVLDKKVEVDLDFGLEIRDVNTSETIAGFMWIDLITDQLNKALTKNN